MLSMWKALDIFFKIVLSCSIILPAADALIHETRRPHPLWKRTTPSSAVPKLHPDTRFPLKFRLRQQNLDKLDQELMRISDPDSEAYGKFWSPEKVLDFFAPSQESHQLVSDWLMTKDPSIGTSDVTIDPLRRWIHVDTTLKQAELVLETTYHHYSDPRGQLHIGCDFYHLPEDLAHHIDIVTPTVQYPAHHPSVEKVDKKLNRRSMKQTQHTPLKREVVTLNAHLPTHPIDRLARCSTTMSLPCLKKMYNLTDYRSIATNLNSFAIVSFTPQHLNLDAIDSLFRLTSPYCVGARPRIQTMGKEGPSSPSEDAGDLKEVEVDVQYSLPLVYPLKVDIYQVLEQSKESSLSFEPLFEALDCKYNHNNRSSSACQIKKPANVMSISYGMDEVSQPLSVLTRQCNEFGKLGLMGVTVLVGSGDDGVAGHGGQCTDPKIGGLAPNGRRFAPTFPASCPWVTAVGATAIPEGGTWQSQEIAMDWSGMHSGGGFSDVFGIPDYQKNTIAAYFAAHRPPYSSAQYNNSGRTRAIPDVSLNGNNYMVAHAEKPGQRPLFYRFHGTSLSTPVMASIIALVNDARLAIGKSPVGFINPSLYSPKFASAFNDIKIGNNRGCMTEGFHAGPGWDPVTGHGTVNAQKLIELWKSI